MWNYIVQVTKLRSDDTFKRNKEDIFNNNFLQNKELNDLLHRLIRETPCSDLLWEIPSGKREGNESILDTAIREFNEETMGLYKNFDILSSYTNTSIIKDGKTHYYTYYYISTPIAPLQSIDINLKLNTSDSFTCMEISNMKWVSFDFLKYLNIPKKQKAPLLSIFNNCIVKYNSSNVKLRCGWSCNEKKENKIENIINNKNWRV